ncbi:putative quinol monooxygenase [Streptomyces iranensis]|uniref:Quinol monooxygenase YgiN n=1 Tax=Streptomyces iranensis TaxID=576784 RepID=A0A060ZTD6_9ACTN|nr:antibiotic biosynthesis monooxygenase family protein [Streptomyces iranensis]MBP2060856.1 quinol monooxygenase YgiN [Streptomyces iranensis]CDR06317.1 predicted protein [Streptomyces iranensis]
MAHISTEDNLFTIINLGTVLPENLDQVMTVIPDMVRAMRRMPGFVSANVHTSDDRTRFVVYAQWESEGHFSAMRQEPALTAHFGRIRDLVTQFTPLTCAVGYSRD